jgi:hypothetical protein
VVGNRRSVAAGSLIWSVRQDMGRGIKFGSTLALIVVVLLLVPFPTRIAGRIKLKFIQSNSQPVPGIRVYQSWECYGFGKNGDASLTSGRDGSVEFPGRAAYSGAAIRFLGKAFTFIAVHASYGARVNLQFQLPSGMRSTSRIRDLSSYNLSILQGLIWIL